MDEIYAAWDRITNLRLCMSRPDICDAAYKEVPKANDMIGGDAWAMLVSGYQFLVCTHGGGIDTSPKSWQSLLLGTIPVIERNALHDAYELLPVAFVHNITDFLTWTNVSQVMVQWRHQLGKFYEQGSHLRNRTLHRLTTKYWYHRMLHGNV